jgi:site-specific DNA-methyltransferase (adenine-specific)
MEVKLYNKNAKKHPDKQLKQIANSLKEFGWQQPIVVDKNGVIIVGHGRWLAYQKYPEGIAEPDIKVANLSEEQAKAYRLADNKLNESEWDMGLAIEELKGLSDEMFDLTGFDRDLLIGPDEKDDVVPEDAPPVAKLGDLWALGEHRLLCGDSTNKDDVARLMGDKKADMVFTDPPYNVNYKGVGQKTSNTIIGDNVDNKQFGLFLGKTFDLIKNNSKLGGGWYIFHNWKNQDIFREELETCGINIETQIIWNKPFGGIGGKDYRATHELIFYCGQNKPVFYGGDDKWSVLDFQKTEKELWNWAKKQKWAEKQGKKTIWSMSKELKDNYVHPTQKPVELISHALFNSSKADDIVLDSFLGSGSTLIACEKTNRICYGIEIDPHYCDVIIKRWENYTGQKAEKVSE